MKPLRFAVPFRIRSIFVFSILSVAAGCEFTPPGPPFFYPVATAEGRLVIDGRPLPAPTTGWLTFYPIDGTVGDPVIVRIAGDGSFRTDRLPVGPLQVRIDFPARVFRDLPGIVQRQLMANRGAMSNVRYTSSATSPAPCVIDLARLPTSR